jgi:hypothetical protein
MYHVLLAPQTHLIRGIITSIIRFREFWKNDIFSDHTYNGSNILIWTIVEPGTYLIAAALLTMRPLFRWAFQDIKMPSYMYRVTSVLLWSKKSSENSKGSYRERKQENIALEYLESTKNLTLGGTTKVSVNDSGRLEEGRSASGTGRSTVTSTTRVSDDGDPWLTNALR